jgi:hypothetical protein
MFFEYLSFRYSNVSVASVASKVRTPLTLLSLIIRNNELRRWSVIQWQNFDDEFREIRFTDSELERRHTQTA